MMTRFIYRLLCGYSIFAFSFAPATVSAQTDLPDSTYLKKVVKKFNDSLSNRIELEKDTLAHILKTGDYLQAAALGEKLSEQFDLADRYVESKAMLDSVFTYYKKTHDPRLQGVYSELGVNYYNKDDYGKAVQYGLLAVKTGETLGDSSATMCKVYSDLALTYNTMADFERAAKYATKGAELARTKHYISPLYLLVSNIAYALSNTKRYDDAIALLDKTAAEYPSTNHTDHLYLLGRYVAVFLDKGRPDEARPYALALLRLGKGPLDCICEYTHWFFTICRYYRANKAFDKLREFIAVCRPQNTLTTIQEIGILSHKFRADSALGQYREAMIDYMSLHRLNDSLFHAKNTAEINKLNIQYETEGKNREIVLQDQKLRLQKTELARSHAVRNTFYYITAALMLITGLFVGLYRLKTRKNRELGQQKAIIDNKNDRLHQLLREKEWLLKEIHHRVKNNLQIIMSLLNSQNYYTKDRTANEAIQKCQARVNAMAIIHQKLYRSSDMSTIDLPDYITDLVGYFRSGYVLRQQVDFSLDLIPLSLDVSFSVPLALILNEAITNSLKYAFTSVMGNVISICLHLTAAEEVELRISDNGVGLPPDFDPEQSLSLGMRLIKGLTEDIGGSYSINGDNGTSISVRFPTGI